MNKKTNILVTSIIGAITTTCVAIVSYIEPTNIVVINTIITGISGAVIELCNIFTKKEVK